MRNYRPRPLLIISHPPFPFNFFLSSSSCWLDFEARGRRGHLCGSRSASRVYLCLQRASLEDREEEKKVLGPLFRAKFKIWSGSEECRGNGGRKWGEKEGYYFISPSVSFSLDRSTKNCTKAFCINCSDQLLYINWTCLSKMSALPIFLMSLLPRGCVVVWWRCKKIALIGHEIKMSLRTALSPKLGEERIEF